MIISISGQARAGKDSFADLLVQKLQGQWTKMALGSYVKSLFSNIYGVDKHFIEYWKCREESPPQFHMNMRKMLQLVGESFRSMNSSTWIDMLKSDACDGTNVIVTDVRYINELEAVKSMDSICILVGRSGRVSDDPHESEATVVPTLNWLLENTTGSVVNIRDFDDVSHPPVPPMLRLYDYFIRNDQDLAALAEIADSCIVTINACQDVV